MTETIVTGCDQRQKWLWADVMNDLEVRGGLSGVVIDPLSVKGPGCRGVTESGTHFNIIWIHGKFMMLSMSQFDDALVNAFSKVVELRPYAQYFNKYGLLTYEWSWDDPDERYRELTAIEDIESLARIS